MTVRRALAKVCFQLTSIAKRSLSNRPFGLRSGMSKRQVTKWSAWRLPRSQCHSLRDALVHKHFVSGGVGDAGLDFPGEPASGEGEDRQTALAEGPSLPDATVHG
jgi:hypothetical protein